MGLLVVLDLPLTPLTSPVGASVSVPLTERLRSSIIAVRNDKGEDKADSSTDNDSASEVEPAQLMIKQMDDDEHRV